MKKYIKQSFIVTTIILILVLASCSAAPPVEPNDGFQPYSAPNAPSGVTATNGYADTITVRWNEVEGATGYQIWAIEAKKYGSSSKKASSSTSYSSLIERGFQLLDVVESTSYKISNENTNTSYVFSVVAMKGARSSGSVLYSVPSTFVQGGTIGEILFSAVANSEQVALYWDISNAYSVLEDSEKKKALYSYKIYISYKLSSEEEWGEALELGEEELTEHTHSYPATTLDIDTKYDFKMKLEILGSDGKAINTIESATYTVLTDSTLVPESVQNLTASTGETTGEITLSWAVPPLPKRDDIKPVFTIERSTDGETWEKVEEGYAEVDTSGETATASYTDKTVQDNTVYSYRVLNGYQLEGQSAIYQMGNNASTIKNVYSFWLPTDVKFDISGGDNSKTIIVSYTYNPPKEQTEEEEKKEEEQKEEEENSGTEKKGQTRAADDQQSSEDTSGTTTDTDAAKKIEVFIGGEYRLETELGTSHTLNFESGTTRTISLGNNDKTTLRYYTIEASFRVGGKEILTVTCDKEITLGTSSATNLISDFQASKNLVGSVKLSWKATDATSYTYEIYEDGDKKNGFAVCGPTDGYYYVELDRGDGKNHNYKIKVAKGTSYDIKSAVGNSLAVPAGLSASDSTSIEGITITWTPVKDENVVYKLYYSDKEKDGDWTELTYTTAGEAFLSAKRNETDGMPYYFKLQAYNKTQSKKPFLESKVEEGSVFGSALMNATVKDNGKDPDKITITWTGIEGASYYRIKRNGGEYLPGRTTATSYSDSVSSIKNLGGNTPLCETYTYTVVPFMSDGTAAVEGSEAKGKLFAPPVNIKASKGTEVDNIKVTWSPVDYATGYEIERYESKLINGAVTTSGVSLDTVSVTGTSYSESTNKIISYRIRSVHKETINGEEVVIKSGWQDGTETEKNAQGFDESSHVGYGLSSVSTLSVASAFSGDYYAPYVTVTWSMVPGATSYTITNGLGGTVTISTSALSYDKNKETSTGTSTSSGYLSYNPSTQQYTYYDNSGRMTNTYAISSYSIVANNGSTTSGSKSNGTTVYRQPTATEWVNIINSILQPAFKYVDNQKITHKTLGITYTDKDEGDWWISWPNDPIDITYYNSTFVFHFEDDAYTYEPEKNYLSISSYYDTERKLTLKTTENIRFDVNNNKTSGYKLDNSLTLVGNGAGIISVETGKIDGYKRLKDFTIEYNSVKPSSDGGTYTVTISGSSAQDVQNSGLNKIL